MYNPVYNEYFKVKVSFVIVAFFITSSFLYDTVEVWLMVLLTHTNVMVRPSKRSELGSLRNLTSINATNANANENTILGSVFMLKGFIQCYLVWDYALSTFAKFSEKLIFFIGRVRNISFSECTKWMNDPYFKLYIIMQQLLPKTWPKLNNRHISRQFFYSPWKYQKTWGFVMLSGVSQWHEMG